MTALTGRVSSAESAQASAESERDGWKARHERLQTEMDALKQQHAQQLKDAQDQHAKEVTRLNEALRVERAEKAELQGALNVSQAAPQLPAPANVLPHPLTPNGRAADPSRESHTVQQQQHRNSSRAQGVSPQGSMQAIIARHGPAVDGSIINQPQPPVPLSGSVSRIANMASPNDMSALVANLNGGGGLSLPLPMPQDAQHLLPTLASALPQVRPLIYTFPPRAFF